MTKVNRKWHDKNRMPKNATTKQRIKWHHAHSKACACRPIPAKILRLTEKQSEKPATPAKKTILKPTSKKK